MISSRNIKGSFLFRLRKKYFLLQKNKRIKIFLTEFFQTVNKIFYFVWLSIAYISYYTCLPESHKFTFVKRLSSVNNLVNRRVSRKTIEYELRRLGNVATCLDFLRAISRPSHFPALIVILTMYKRYEVLTYWTFKKGKKTSDFCELQF